MPAGDVRVWYITLAACPWIAIVAHAILARGLRAPDARAATTLNAWVQRLRRQRRPVAVWRARLAGPRAAAIAVEVGRAARVARSGAGVARLAAGVRARRGTLARRVGGSVRGPGDRVRSPARGERRSAPSTRWCASAGWRRRRATPTTARWRASTSALFPGGFTLRVGHRPPAAFRALPADVRQAIWRDAIRRVAGGRHRASAASPAWQVSAFAPAAADPRLRAAAARPSVALGSRRAGARLGRTASAIELADSVDGLTESE